MRSFNISMTSYLKELPTLIGNQSEVYIDLLLVPGHLQVFSRLHISLISASKHPVLCSLFNCLSHQRETKAKRIGFLIVIIHLPSIVV